MSFTGGTATTKHIIKTVSEPIKKMKLELGGNNAAIFLESCDVHDKCLEKYIEAANRWILFGDRFDWWQSK